MWREKKKLSHGNYGEVYQVKDQKGRDYALKIYSKNIKHSISEMDVLFRVKNPHLLEGIKVLISPEENSKVGVLENLMTGDIDDFQSLMAKYYPSKTEEMTLYNLKKLILQIAMAGKCLFSAGYLHLDIKPKNILYHLEPEKSDEEKFNFYLSDYGLLLPHNFNSDSRQYLKVSVLRGTDGYMAPEYLNYKRAYYSTMTYQLGLVIYDLISPEKTDEENTDEEGSDRTIDFSRIEENEVTELMKKMLDENPLSRPTFSEVISFLCKMIDWEEKCFYPVELPVLDIDAKNLTIIFRQFTRTVLYNIPLNVFALGWILLLRSLPLLYLKYNDIRENFFRAIISISSDIHLQRYYLEETEMLEILEGLDFKVYYSPLLRTSYSKIIQIFQNLYSDGQEFLDLYADRFSSLKIEDSQADINKKLSLIGISLFTSENEKD